MKRTKLKRALAAFLAAAFFLGMTGACGKEESGDGNVPDPKNGGSGDVGKGRYVEQEEPLPEELEDWAILQMFTAEDKIHLLAAGQQEDKTVLREWALQDEGFVDVTPAWLASLELPAGDWIDARLALAKDGTRYLYAGYAAEGEEFLGHLWKPEGGTLREITPEKWTVPNEDWGGYEMIQGIGALDNGSVIALSYSSVDILSGEDGSVAESTPLSVFYEGGVLTDGKNAYFLSSDEEGCRIEKWIESKGGSIETIPFAEGGSSDSGAISVGGTGSLAMDILQDGTLIAANENGIFRLPGGSLDQVWEKLAEGIETDFAVSENICLGLSALEDGSIYALFQSEGRQKLNRYEYDPGAVSKIKEVLRLYTVYEDSLLKQAAALYHKAHPEVQIIIEYEYPMYSYEQPDYDTVYKKLNTRLLGEDAPDLLVLDHLNIASYAQKGLLEDLSSIVGPLEEDGTLLSNITGVYAEEGGKRYVVPLQFGFQIALGRDISAEAMSSMEKLADFLANQEDSYLGTRTTEELVDMFYPFFCSEIAADKQLDREALSRYMDYLKAIGDNCGMISSRPENEVSYSIWDLAGRAKLAVQEVRGFADCMFPMSMADQIKGEYAAFENSFSPFLQMGICTKSQFTDTAEDFLRFALSEQVQDTDYYNGFPVNRVSLQSQASKDRSEYIASATIVTDDGSFVEFESKAYSAETAQRLFHICETLEKPVKEDAKIREVLMECLGGYLDGSRTKEDVIQRIEGGLKMYLAE